MESVSFATLVAGAVIGAAIHHLLTGAAQMKGLQFGTEAHSVVSALSDVGLWKAVNRADSVWTHRWAAIKSAHGPDAKRVALQTWFAWLHSYAYHTNILPAKLNGHLGYDRTPGCSSSTCKSLGRRSQEHFLEEQVRRLRTVYSSRLPCLRNASSSGCSCLEWDGTYLPWLQQLGVCSKDTSYKLVYNPKERVDTRRRILYGDLQRGIEFIPASLKFDMVWCTSVFEHLQYPHVGMKQLARLTRPGGFVSWSVPWIAAWHSSPKDYFRISHDGLETLARDAGLDVAEIYAAGNRRVTVGSLQGYGADYFGEKEWQPRKMFAKSKNGKTRKLERKRRVDNFYMTVFADIFKPSTPRAGIQYESSRWLYSSRLELLRD